MIAFASTKLYCASHLLHKNAEKVEALPQSYPRSQDIILLANVVKSIGNAESEIKTALRISPKVERHGGKMFPSPQFLAIVDPKVAVISGEANNLLGHLCTEVVVSDLLVKNRIMDYNKRSIKNNHANEGGQIINGKRSSSRSSKSIN